MESPVVCATARGDSTAHKANAIANASDNDRDNDNDARILLTIEPFSLKFLFGFFY